ncbi:hypothetical protein BFP70_03415 [Thioclava sp. SK-1]|uniref:DUF6173 family protein n=1 Tax=Thioclava sp. SK-1 TaxID=1889770 RepID=UPI0008255781|nr:DUF6173 family protein [Thioclava sp. SK-1]OCX66890.1 hypothetical protein BFP70_03415 [Thioclava sp. SK-1]
MTDDIVTTAEALENSVMPRAHAVHTDDSRPPTAEMCPLPAKLARDTPESKSAAQWAYERLVLYIQNFEQSLQADEEVALGLTGSNAGVLKIEGIGYFAPDILTFYGTNQSGARTQLIQHVSQLDVALVAMPKPVDAPAPRRIGFRLARDLDDDGSETNS